MNDELKETIFLFWDIKQISSQLLIHAFLICFLNNKNTITEADSGQRKIILLTIVSRVF